MAAPRSGWLVPVGTFVLAVLISLMGGSASSVVLRPAQATTGEGCHRPLVIPGDHLRRLDIDGVAFDVGVPADCSQPGPGIGPIVRKFETIDCRRKNGTFFASARSIGQVGAASAAPVASSANNVRKELHLTRRPATRMECCDTFSAGADLLIGFDWVIAHTGPALKPGNEGRVLMNDPGHARRQIVRTEWLDCDGVPRFRERTIVSFLEAEMAWNVQGKIILNKSILRIQEFFETDQQEQRGLGKPQIVRGVGSGGSVEHPIREFHPDTLDPRNRFRGEQAGDVAASVRITGSVDVVAESPRGSPAPPLPANAAIGVYHFRVLGHKLVDETESITVPDP